MTDCIVVGGGLIGMLTARFLREEGADVLVIERNRLGCESSWAGGGILSPLYPWRYPDAVTYLAKDSQRYYAHFAQTLLEETGIDPEWVKSGLLVLDKEEKTQAQTWGKDYEVSLEILELEALKECEPLLGEEFNEGLWMPSIAQIRNPRLVKALRASLKTRGIRYVEQKKVLSLSMLQGVVKGVNTANETIEAERVLIASGAWSPQLIPLQFSPIKVEPVRGQMIVFRAKPDTLQHIVLYRGHYAIPRKDGRILVGSTIEYVGFNKQISEEALGVLSDAAVEMIPSILDFPIEHHWSGLRPGTSSGIPYIGEHPEIEGLYLNCGHFRNGVVLGLSSARLAADIMLRKTPALSPEAYSINAPR
jgi:glycine oxidase